MVWTLLEPLAAIATPVSVPTVLTALGASLESRLVPNAGPVVMHSDWTGDAKQAVIRVSNGMANALPVEATENCSWMATVSMRLLALLAMNPTIGATRPDACLATLAMDLQPVSAPRLQARAAITTTMAAPESALLRSVSLLPCFCCCCRWPRCSASFCERSATKM
jgi:hypothetical protein